MQIWEKVARKLRCGVTVRELCCGKDKSLVISHTDRGYSCKCFRCGVSNFRPHGQRSAAEMLKHKQELLDYTAHTGVLELPKDFTTTIPPEGAQWLLKAGISTSVTLDYTIGWSEKLGRVVMPVYDGATLVAVQSRAVYKGQTPKYWNTNARHNVMFKATPRGVPALKDTVVITEDILSCIRVGKIIPCRSSLGTSVSKVMVTELLKTFSTVLVWYDGDEAGERGAVKARRNLLLQGAEVSVINTMLDPKDYNNEEILDYIIGATE